MRFAILLLALLLSAGASAADKPCTKADAGNALKTLDRVSSWPQMQKAWQDYRHCDSEATGEQFTDVLLRLVIDWKNVDAFAAAMKDAPFREFVHAHLLSPGAKDDLPDVYSRAKSSCPKGQETFCAELAEVAKPKK
jgi:hypothetical protein